MLINRKQTLKSLKDQTQIQDQIETEFKAAIDPLIPEVDSQLRFIYGNNPLDTQALRNVFYNPLTGLNVKAEARLFPLAEVLEDKIRGQFETLGFEFESAAMDFFQSVTARSLYVFAEWFIDIASRSFIEGRSFGIPLEVRGKGYFYQNGVRVYFNYAKKRAAGETRRKLWKDKAQGTARQVFDPDKIFKEELAGVLKESGLDNIDDALSYIEPASPRPSYTLLGKKPAQASNQKNHFLVETKNETGQTIGVYGFETKEGF